MKLQGYFGFMGSVFLGLFLSVALAFAVVERVILISIDGIRNSEGFGDPDCQGQVDDGNCLLTNLKTLVDDGMLYTSEPPITTNKGSAFVNNAATWTTPGHTMLLSGVRDIEPNIGETVCPPGSGTNQIYTRNNTVLIITTDHGRESFTVKSHGGLDWGNRAIFLLGIGPVGIGPGIPAGQVFTNNPTGTGCKRRSDGVAFPCRQQEDLAPTIASMLAPTYTVTVPDAEGVVMAELLGQTPGSFPLQRAESRVVASQGKLHVVWSERDTTTGERVINYQQVDPAQVGSTFTIPVPPPNPSVVKLSQANNTDGDGRRITASQPYIFAKGLTIHLAYSVTRSIQEEGDNLAEMYIVSSSNGGATWSAPQRVAPSIVENPGPPVICMEAYFSPATVLEVNQSATVLRRWVFTMRLSTEVLGFYQDQVTGPWTEVAIVPPAQQCPSTLDNLEIPAAGGELPGPGYLAQRPDATVEGQRVELVWQAVGTDNRWDVFRSKQENFADPNDWLRPPVQISPTGVTGYLPAVSLQGNTLNVLWADNEEAGPVWRVRGNQATGPVSGSNAFLPDTVPTSASQVFAVYSRIVDPITTDNYDIYWNESTTGGQTWPDLDTLLTPAGTSPDPSLYPSVTHDQAHQQIWVVWREGNGPNWAVKGQLVKQLP